MITLVCYVVGLVEFWSVGFGSGSLGCVDFGFVVYFRVSCFWI